jgi:ribonucleoside-diphosphate reductase alpha chain
MLPSIATPVPLSETALEVAKKRYLQPGETVDQMWHRVARNLADVEARYSPNSAAVRAWEARFYEVMAKLEFLPAGRTLANDPARGLKIVANCLVLHPQDSMESIMDTLKKAALCQKAGCGIGFPFTFLRPAGQVTKTVPGVASGPVSFMSMFNAAFDVIRQQQRHGMDRFAVSVRPTHASRGANMAVLEVHHPDILEFVHCKEKEGTYRNFNISVGLTDEFMRAVERDAKEPWRCRFGGHDYPVRRVVREPGTARLQHIEELHDMTAPQLFDEILRSAWNNGEPGTVFLDEVNRHNPLLSMGRIAACNPCGEQFLAAHDVCNLGSINLARFHSREHKRGVNWERLREVTALAVHMLDNVVDLFEFPVKEVQKMCRANRRLGLGIMGLADLLYLCRVPYDSKEGRELAEKIVVEIKRVAEATSEDLGVLKGHFPNYPRSEFVASGKPRRNAALLSIAPTGTLSMVADASGGVEPVFSLAFEKKNILGGSRFVYTNQEFRRALISDEGFTEEQADAAVERVAAARGSARAVPELPERIRRVFCTALDIAPMDHVLMQAALQRHVCNAVSKVGCGGRIAALGAHSRHADDQPSVRGHRGGRAIHLSGGVEAWLQRLDCVPQRQQTGGDPGSPEPARGRDQEAQRRSRADQRREPARLAQARRQQRPRPARTDDQGRAARGRVRRRLRRQGRRAARQRGVPDVHPLRLGQVFHVKKMLCTQVLFLGFPALLSKP